MLIRFTDNNRCQAERRALLGLKTGCFPTCRAMLGAPVLVNQISSEFALSLGGVCATRKLVYGTKFFPFILPAGVALGRAQKNDAGLR